MKKNYFITLLCFLSFLQFSQAQIISQYIETNSGTTPKGIEIWNNTSNTLDFSTNNLIIQQGTNGGNLSNKTLINSGSLAPGEVIVIGTSDIGAYLTSQLLTSVTFVDFTFEFNGDDALAVVFGGTTTDIFGNPGNDPGSAWSGNGVSTANQNIQLKSGVISGSTGFTDPSTRFETVSTSNPLSLNGFGVPPVSITSPTLIASSLAITNLDYEVGNGPSVAQDFIVSGANLDLTDVIINAPTNFEVSLDNSTFVENLALNSFDGTSTPIWVRLKSGLAVNAYSDTLSISGGGATPVDVNLSGSVTPPATLGWQITTTDQLFSIDFDQSVAGVNKGAFDGSGIVSNPGDGQLNSNAWATTGMSDGDSAFGDDNDSDGDLARGISTGGVTTGGFYAFQTPTGNASFGVQATGSEFNPGSITLRVQNQSGTTITDADIAYVVYVYNDQDRSNSFNFSYSTDNSTFTSIPELDLASDVDAMSSPAWEAYYRNTRISGLSIADGAFLYLRWNSNDISGSGSRDEFGLDDIQLIANPSTSPTSPVLSIDGNYRSIVLGTNTQVASAASVSGNLSLLDNVIFSTNDNFTFKSTAMRNGVLTEVPSSASINGSVTTERFFTARRAFRFVSPSVTTSGTINANWQESGSNAPGFGTHITGNGGAANGFDVSGSNNPSLFTFDNLNQNWAAVTNTNSNTLSVGTPYRLFVRGDRTVSLTDNNATPSETILRTTGDLHTGDFQVNNLSDTVDEFNFVGNPYQAVVDMNSVITEASNIKNDFFVWDPSLNARGAYVTVNSADGSNNLPLGESTSASNDLQPGQAVFLENTATAPTSVIFKESHKNTSSAAAMNLFNSVATGKIFISIHTDGNSPAMDATQLRFSAAFDSNSSTDDAGKIINPDETLSINNNASLKSIERRNYPVQTDTLSLFTDRYRHANYILRISGVQLDNSYTYSLYDRFTQQTLPISNTSFDYAFSVDQNQALSIATDRFEVIVSNQTLSIGGVDFNDRIRLFPNPTSNGQINLSLPTEAKDVSINLYNMTGQRIFGKNFSQPERTISLSELNLNAGLYHIVITINGQNIVKKLIVK